MGAGCCILQQSSTWVGGRQFIALQSVCAHNQAHSYGYCLSLFDTLHMHTRNTGASISIYSLTLCRWAVPIKHYILCSRSHASNGLFYDERVRMLADTSCLFVTSLSPQFVRPCLYYLLLYELLGLMPTAMFGGCQYAIGRWLLLHVLISQTNLSVCSDLTYWYIHHDNVLQSMCFYQRCHGYVHPLCIGCLNKDISLVSIVVK